MKIINPALFLPITFVLCLLTAIATGTSWGAAGTMDIALIGVAQGMGMPLPLWAILFQGGAVTEVLGYAINGFVCNSDLFGVPVFSYFPFAIMAYLSSVIAVDNAITGSGVFHCDDKIVYRSFWRRKIK